MTPEQIKRRAGILTTFSSHTAVVELSKCSPVQITIARSSGRCSAHTTLALSQLRLAHLEAYSATVSSKGTSLRLRALYALGVSMEGLSYWDIENKPEGLTAPPLWRYAKGAVKRIDTGHHLWIKKAFDHWEQIPETKLSAVCRSRAFERGWLRPIELEQDLMDIPEPWASQMLAERAEAMTSTEKQRSHKAVIAGERSELAVAGREAYYREYNEQRRMKRAL